MAEADLLTDEATTTRDTVQERLKFNFNSDLTVENVRKQIGYVPPPAPEKKSTFRKVQEFFGQPIINLISRDIGGIISANRMTKAENAANTQDIQTLFDAKDKYASGQITKEQFNQRLLNIRNQPTLDSGKDLPTGKQVVGDVLGSALTVAPVWEIRALKGLPLLQKFVRGGLYGAGFMGSAAMSENKKADAIIKDAGIGFLFGGPMEMVLGPTLKLLGGGYTKAVGGLSKKIEQSAVAGLERLGVKAENLSGKALYASVARRLSEDFGELGAKVVNTYEAASVNTKKQLGMVVDKLNKAGFFQMGADNAWKNPNSLLNQLEGRWEAGKDEVFKIADQLRKEVSAMATELLPDFRGMKNYFPHLIHEVDYLKKPGLIREEVLQNMVLNEGFEDIGKAGQALDDFILTIEQGSAVKGKKNSWIQYMLDHGYAQSEEEAVGKTTRYFANRDNPQNRISNFLENPRDFNVPFYDPNPTRVLPLYAMDSFSRLNIVRGFGAKDEVLNEIIGKIKMKGEANDRELVGLINILKNQVKSLPSEDAASKFLRAINVFKLTFSAIINPGQHLNTLLVSNFGSFGKGWLTALTNKSQFLENGLKTGASVEYFIRNELLKRGYSASFADKYLRMIGFSATERFNRNFSATVGINYAEKLAKELGLEVQEADKGRILKMIEQQKAEQVELGLKMRDLRNAKMEEYNTRFGIPFNDEQYKLVSTKQAQGRLNRLEQVYSQKTERLQKILTDVEKKMAAAGRANPDAKAQLADLASAIASTKEEMAALLPQESAKATEAFSTTPEEVAQATAESIALARKKMQETLDKLQEKLNQLSDENFEVLLSQGEVAPTVQDIIPQGGGTAVATKPVTSEQKLVALKRKRDELQKQLIALQNELTEKERVLTTILDPRAAAEAELNKANPNRGQYQKFLAEQQTAKGDMTPANKQRRNAEAELADLIGGPEHLQEAKLRGFLTEDDMLVAGQVMSEMTQFSSDPRYLPSWTSSPLGKMLFQYKNFGYRQSTFVKNRVVTLLKRGDYGGLFQMLAVMGTVMPMTSEVLLDLRSLITNEKRPTWGDRPVARYFDDFFRIGGLGIMYDVINSANYGRLVEFFAGPTLTSAAQVGESVVNAGKQIFKGDVGKGISTLEKGAEKFLVVPKKIFDRFRSQRRQKGEKTFYDELFSQANLNPFSVPTASASMVPNRAEGGQPKRNSKSALTPAGLTDDDGNIIAPTPSEAEINRIIKNVVAGVDISKYATDPTHEKKVRGIYNSLPDFATAGDIDRFIKEKYPSSPITGAMVAKAALKYEIDPKLLIAIMRQDSSLGTAGLGAKTKNPGNVGNNDRGQVVKYKTWDEGVLAVARFLSKYKV